MCPGPIGCASICGMELNEQPDLPYGSGWWRPPRTIVILGALPALFAVAYEAWAPSDLTHWLVFATVTLIAVALPEPATSPDLPTAADEMTGPVASNPALLRTEQSRRRKATVGWLLVSVATAFLGLQLDLWDLRVLDDPPPAAAPQLWMVAVAVWTIPVLLLVPPWWRQLRRWVAKWFAWPKGHTGQTHVGWPHVTPVSVAPERWGEPRPLLPLGKWLRQELQLMRSSILGDFAVAIFHGQDHVEPRQAQPSPLAQEPSDPASSESATPETSLVAGWRRRVARTGKIVCWIGYCPLLIALAFGWTDIHAWTPGTAELFVPVCSVLASFGLLTVLDWRAHGPFWLTGGLVGVAVAVFAWGPWFERH
jgi:hypothetical protein